MSLDVSVVRRTNEQKRNYRIKFMSRKTQPNEEAQIRKVIDDWAYALRNKDTDDVLSHYAPSLIHFSLAPPLLSVQSNAKDLKAWFATWQGPIGYEIRDLNITVGGDVAFSHSLNRIQGTNTAGGKDDLWFRHTLGFRKIDEQWKIVHEHESVPFYMDGSFKAAVDLKP
jgi:PhnB protein